ncbi:MAG TPA: hypothetical protein PKO39_04980 [Bacilli bacterium]|nr:hypothetical protein [Bacilli bacterium]HPZ27287.1 hypothetical protein [Bacilli bacterium]HQC89691.1 hypothetical protein [Bacilli bacterium]
MNLLRKLKDFFAELFGKFSLDNLLILFFGIIIGFLVCLMIYLVFVFISLKKGEKRYQAQKQEIEDEKIARLIRSARNLFIEEYANETLGQKINAVGKISWNLINDIAKVYYPKSNYPIYELSLDELIILNHYITDRVDMIFKGPVLSPLKKVKIANILKLFEIKKKIDENVAVKAANKLKIPKILQATVAVLNIFNPAYWVKKLMVNTTILAASNKICTTIIDVVGEETNKVYSKNVFNREKIANLEIEQSILELESMVEKE